MKDEISKGNSYFFTDKLDNVRTLFRYRTDLFECKMNYKNKYRKEGFNCDSCESEIENSTHVLFCPVLPVLREHKCHNSDSDLCEYLQKVLEIRTNLRLNR